MNKYYTPELEEFHVGFEFEFFDPDDKDWTLTKISCQSELCNWTSYDIDYLRVKYLDKEDIERFGFEEMNNNNPNFGKCFKYKQYNLRREMNTGGFLLTLNDLTRTPESYNLYKEIVLFRGMIKNKSEFQRVLKQVGIL